MSSNYKKSEESTRRNNFDAYTRQIAKISINHQTTETPSKPCFAKFQASFFFNFNSSNYKKNEKEVPVEAILMHVHGKLWSLE